MITLSELVALGPGSTGPPDHLNGDCKTQAVRYATFPMHEYSNLQKN